MKDPYKHTLMTDYQQMYSGNVRMITRVLTMILQSVSCC